MPRSNRPKRSRAARAEPDTSLDRLVSGWRRTEVRRGATWNVQPVASNKSLKEYVCPGCARTIEPGAAHLVTWRADGVLGEQADLEGRRHWHDHCWRIA